nr:transposase [Burkholderia contaminans]
MKGAGHDRHRALFERCVGRVVGREASALRMTNSGSDFDRLLSYLQALPGNCRVALEPTGDYHRPLAHRPLTAGHEVVSINSVAQPRYREAMFNSWDKNDPKDAQVILEMLRRGIYQRYVDPQIAGHHELQELAKTYCQVSRARTKVQHSLINHCLPLYFPEMHRYWCTTRNEWFVFRNLATTTLCDLLQDAVHDTTLDFLVGNDSDVLVDSLDMMFLNRLATFTNAVHVFDDEPQARASLLIRLLTHHSAGIILLRPY